MLAAYVGYINVGHFPAITTESLGDGSVAIVQAPELLYAGDNFGLILFRGNEAARWEAPFAELAREGLAAAWWC